MKNKIKAIIFDVGGVLALSKTPLIYHRGRYHNFGVHEYVVRKLRVSIDQYFDSIDTTYAKAFEGKLLKNQVLNIFSRNFKKSQKKIENIYKKAYKKNFKQNKQLFKQAFKLKKLGYKIAILSDQWYISQEVIMPERLYKKFSVVITSCNVGLRKPNPKIYRLTLKKLKIKPAEAIFIDNQDWNLKPAKKLGIKTILFKNNKELFKNKIWKNLFK